MIYFSAKIQNIAESAKFQCSFLLELLIFANYDGFCQRFCIFVFSSKDDE